MLASSLFVTHKHWRMQVLWVCIRSACRFKSTCLKTRDLLQPRSTRACWIMHLLLSWKNMLNTPQLILEVLEVAWKSITLAPDLAPMHETREGKHCSLLWQMSSSLVQGGFPLPCNELYQGKGWRGEVGTFWCCTISAQCFFLFFFLNFSCCRNLCKFLVACPNPQRMHTSPAACNPLQRGGDGCWFKQKCHFWSHQWQVTLETGPRST